MSAKTELVFNIWKLMVIVVSGDRTLKIFSYGRAQGHWKRYLIQDRDQLDLTTLF